MEFLGRLWQALIVIWPPNAIRVMRRGAEKAATFRAKHGREPTDEEWKAMANQVDRDIFH